MQAIISPGHITGTITPPPSKSIMQRICAAALLHNGKTIIHNPGISNDDKAALHIIKQLGATVLNQNDSIEITSAGIKPVSQIIDCAESGLSARLFIPIAALHNTPLTITGHGSLLKRPMDAYPEDLLLSGVSVTSNNGLLPVTVKGPLAAKNITVDGAGSSQFLSGLLFAYAYAANEPVTITVSNLNSKPYIDLTLDILQRFGKNIVHRDYEYFFIDPVQFIDVPLVELTIEADWSAASNFIVAKAVAGDIEINNLDLNSLQADKAIMKVVTSVRTAFSFDATHSPDLIPILSVYAGICRGTSYIKGLKRLMHKESNRIESIKAMLTQLGVSFIIKEDTLCIEGRNDFESCTVNAYNDHRIVMAAAIAALGAKGDITVNGAEAVSKSYPGFFSDLSSLGVKCNFKQ